jgi:hypothetical protein
MRDAYIRFFAEGYISKEQFFDFGLKETIYIPYEKAESEWERLKYRIQNNEKVFIRGFGRDSTGTHLFQNLYRLAINNSNVLKDATNNAEPTKVIRRLTCYSKSKSTLHEPIRNYQISHIFGRTKNVYAFTAPWNIVYMPKLLDPFTGHEAKGDLIDEYTELFQKQGYAKFAKLIDEFNEIVTNTVFIQKLENCFLQLVHDMSVTSSEINKLKKAVADEFAPIELIKRKCA